jgi:hypothetical protein
MPTANFRRPSNNSQYSHNENLYAGKIEGNNEDESVTYDFSASKMNNSRIDEPSMVFFERQKIEKMKEMIKKLETENMLLKGYAKYGIDLKNPS